MPARTSSASASRVSSVDGGAAVVNARGASRRCGRGASRAARARRRDRPRRARSARGRRAGRGAPPPRSGTRRRSRRGATPASFCQATKSRAVPAMRCAATSPTTRERSSSNSHRRCFARYCSAAASSASPEKAIERSTVSSPWSSRGRSAGEIVTVRSGSSSAARSSLPSALDREREVGERHRLHAHALAGERRELLARPRLGVEQVVHECDDGQLDHGAGRIAPGFARYRRRQRRRFAGTRRREGFFVRCSTTGGNCGPRRARNLGTSAGRSRSTTSHTVSRFTFR